MIYLDNQATTAVDKRVVAEMLPYFERHFGNATSGHALGWHAHAAVELARDRVADLIGAAPNEVVFTSGATEANNLALLGVAREHPGMRVITTPIEHSSVLQPCARLATEGHDVTLLSVDRGGVVQDAVPLARGATLLSVHLVNNEIGVIQPVAELARAARSLIAGDLVVHCDAAQALGKTNVDVRVLGVDLLTLSSHKMYGPKGVGALWVRSRPRIALTPLVFGGGQERGLRSGTVPVPLVVGFGVAALIAKEEQQQYTRRIEDLGQELWDRLRLRVPQVELNGAAKPRVPGSLNVRFPGVRADSLLAEVRTVAFSTGAACASESSTPSHVLLALGLKPAHVAESVRLSIGRFNTSEDIEMAAIHLGDAVNRLRARART